MTEQDIDHQLDRLSTRLKDIVLEIQDGAFDRRWRINLALEKIEEASQLLYRAARFAN